MRFNLTRVLMLVFILGCGAEGDPGQTSTTDRAIPKEHASSERLSPASALDLFAAYEPQAEQLEFDSEYASDSVRYATGLMWSPEPYYDEADLEENDVPFRSWLKESEVDALESFEKDYLYEHGYDVTGRLRYVSSFSDGWYCYLYGEEYLDVVQLLHGEVWRVIRYLYKDGLVRYRYEIASDAFLEQRYEYENGRCTRCVGRQWTEQKEGDQGEGDWQLLEFSPHFEYEVDGEGKLQRAYRYFSGDRGTQDTVDRELVFVRHGHETPDAVVEQIQSFLIDAVQQAVRDHDGGEPLCCIRVPYYLSQPASFWPPPGIYIATASDQAAFLKENPDKPFDFWEQDLSVLDLAPPPAELEEAILISKRWIQPVDGNLDQDLSQRVIRDTAQKLNDLDWSRIAEVTEDFVVCAWDESYDSPALEDVVNSVPEKRLKELQAKGLIP